MKRKDKSRTLKVGRPTKYSDALIGKVLDFIKQQSAKGVPPFIERLAYELDIDTDTVVEWCKEHEEFSVAIKKLKQVQAAMLQEGIYADSKAHGAGGIFLLKNNHGFKDKSEVENTGTLIIEQVEYGNSKDTNTP